MPVPCEPVFVRDDIRFGFPPNGDMTPASDTLGLGIGQCNTKGTLLLALCQAAGIPARLHFAPIRRSIQRGLYTGMGYVLLPRRISHSWLEVHLDGHWRAVDAYINDTPFCQAAVRELHRRGWREGFSVAGACAGAGEPFDVDAEQFVQMGAVEGDHGVWTEPADYYRSCLYRNRTGPIKTWLYRRIAPDINRSIERLRSTSVISTSARGQKGGAATLGPTRISLARSKLAAVLQFAAGPLLNAQERAWESGNHAGILLTGAIVRSFINGVGGRYRIRVPGHRELVLMQNGEQLAIFRQMDLEAPGQPQPSGEFRVRFRTRMAPRLNEWFSWLTIPLFSGLPGFREKTWLVNEVTGFSVGIYHWQTVDDAARYADSPALAFMTSRSYPGTITHWIGPASHDLTRPWPLDEHAGASAAASTAPTDVERGVARTGAEEHRPPVETIRSIAR